MSKKNNKRLNTDLDSKALVEVEEVENEAGAEGEVEVVNDHSEGYQLGTILYADGETDEEEEKAILSTANFTDEESDSADGAIDSFSGLDDGDDFSGDYDPDNMDQY